MKKIAQKYIYQTLMSFNTSDRSKPLFFIIFLLSIHNSYSQNNDIIFDQLFLQHGLSQSIVTHILQDRAGFMWIGTEDGLNKYDGYEFKVYRNDTDVPGSLISNHITYLYEDKSGTIWIGTFYGGLDSFDPLSNRFSHHKFDSKDFSTISNNNINVIYEDKEENLWIGTDGGLNKYDRKTGKFIRFQNNVNDKKSLSNNIVRSICEDNNGSLWIGTDNGLNNFNKNDETCIVLKNEPGNSNSISNNEIYALFRDKKGELWIGTHGGGLNKLVTNNGKWNTPTFVSYANESNNPKSISNNEIYTIFEDSKGKLWIGTNRGLNIFDRISSSFSSYVHDHFNPSSLSYNEIRAIYEDRSGLIWIGTYGGGINLVNKGKKKFSIYHNIPDSQNSLNENIVWSICEDDSGILWIGTHGGGLNRLDRRQQKYTYYLHNPNDSHSLSSNIVRLVFEDKSKNLWIGTNGGGLNLFDKVTGKFISYTHKENDPLSISHDELRTIYQDRSGTLWIGTNGGGLNKVEFVKGSTSSLKFISYKKVLGDSNSLSNDFIRVIFEDSKENFWIGTQGGGLNKFDRQKNIFKQYRTNKDNSHGITNDYIFAIYEDRKGHLWLGTWGGGIIEFDTHTETFKSYTTKDGLSSGSIYGMLEDEEGFLWLSTNKGLSKFDTDNKIFKNYDVGDGLQNNEFNGGSFFKGKKGELFFGGIGGFNSFFPTEIQDNPHVPPIVITSFKKINKEVTFDRPINLINEIELFNKDYFFAFEFASLDYNLPLKNKYAYKMEGLDENWITTTSDKRYAVYTTLPPGNYRFRVKGSNNDGVWNETGASIDIIIHPPFWRTWWFLIALLMMSVGIIIYSINRRVRIVRMSTELRAAHEAQMSIMPQNDPEIKSYDFSALCIPANEVGGDFFDYLWMDDSKTRLGIVIGDVSGKGMKSAMNAIMCSGMIASLIYNKYSVKEIMTSVNRSLFLKTEKKMFTALCFSVLDIETKKITFTNAGLNPPLLKSNGKVSSLQSIGLKYPLGGFRTTEYQEQVFQLKSGDILLFFSDGISEAQSKDKEFYGVHTLVNLLESLPTENLTARQLKDTIFENVQHFTVHTHQSDDMTLIVIKVN